MIDTSAWREWQLADAKQLRDGAAGKFRGTLLLLVHISCTCCASGKTGVETGFIFFLEQRGSD